MHRGCETGNSYRGRVPTDKVLLDEPWPIIQPTGETLRYIVSVDGQEVEREWEPKAAWPHVLLRVEEVREWLETDGHYFTVHGRVTEKTVAPLIPCPVSRLRR